MFSIAFDLKVADTLANHPKGVTQAYNDIRATLAKRAFRLAQWSHFTAIVKSRGEPGQD